MKIQIISGFKQTEQAFLELENTYLKRLKGKVKLEITEVTIKQKENSDETKKYQSEILSAKIPKNSLLIVLDENGEQLTSKKLATEFQKLLNTGGRQNLVFLIGGPVGLSDEFRLKADKLWSLSKLTLTADFARVILIEQLYRAHSILNNLPYHKE